MHKVILSIAFAAIIHFTTNGQVTVSVTNPANTTPNLAASYTSLANAVTAVNAITAMSGPVTLTCAAGSETAPAGGFSINSPAGTSAINTITFTTSGTVTITASAALTAGSLTDALFKLTGADHITISGFTLRENPANTTTATASNNMTEWGVALLYANTANGAQYNTIENNTITLDRNYPNSFGIYSNTRHPANNTSLNADIANNTTAPNSNNKFYSNTISNVNNGIMLIGSGISANQDQGNDIGGNTAATGNSISNWGGSTATGIFVSAPSFSVTGIYVNNQCNDNISYNTLVSATITLAANTGLQGIYKFYSTQPTGTITSVISNNTVTISDNSASAFSFVNAIRNEGITGLSTATININDNTILNCSETGAASATSWYLIQNNSAAGVVNINNNIIKGNTSTGTASSYTGIYNAGAVITTLNIKNNQLGVAGTGFFSWTVPNGGNLYGIWNAAGTATTTLNIDANSIDGISSQNSGSVTGIFNSGFGTPPGITNIINNQLGSVTGSFVNFSAAQSNSVTGIQNFWFSAASTLLIQHNDIRGIINAVTASNGQSYILCNGPIASQTVTGNTFTNITANTTGGVVFISGPSGMTAGDSWSCTNNNIVGAFNKTGTGGTIYCISTGGTWANGSAMTITGNDFSNMTMTGTTFFAGIYDQAGTFSGGPSKTITGNSFSNINFGNASAYGISVDYGSPVTCSSNTITGFNGTGIFTGITAGSNIAGNMNCAGNTISNITSTTIFYGIRGGGSNIPVFNINGNNFNSINCPGTTVMYIEEGPSVNIYDNNISNLTSASAAAILKGIHVLSCSAANIYRNELYGFSATATASGGIPCIYGMYFNSVVATTVNVYNNFIAGFSAPGFSGTDLIRGIHVGSATASTTYNVYYNSVYLNAGSTGTDFGTCGIYHLVNSTATTNSLNLIDNIIVNTSTPAGTGKTAAFRRSSSVSLANYAAASDYNLLYAGTPSSSRLIYFDGTNADQTLAAFQTRVAPRDANDISVMPNFVSATDLHLTAGNCQLDGRGTPLPGYTTDIDNAARNATTPDMGADEFTAAPVTALAGVTGAGVCEDKNILPSGTTYISNACGMIATVVPSGASPVAGNAHVCVTLDATPQVFNGDPYVQRHFDIEPSTNPAASTATVTLYFTDAEFVQYNSNNPAWPPLPTNGAGNTVANRNNVKVTQFHGVAGTDPSGPGNYPGTRELITPGAANVVWNGLYWAVTCSVTGFSGFYVHTNSFNAPLPVVLNYFTGRKEGGQHILDWKVTCISSPRVTMELERSADSRNFTAITSITADAIRCDQPFDHADTDPLEGINYYRLKMTDADGKITYSSIVALLNALKGFDIISIAPNPVVSDHFSLNVASAKAGTMVLGIFDMQGRMVSRQHLVAVAGFNTVPVTVSNLAAGTYLLRCNMDGGEAKQLRFVRTAK